jgi:hypothetical protein
VSVNKSRSFRGKTEIWSNVYHYSLATNLDVTLATDLVDQIATAEKLCHSSGVTFEDGRVWEVGGTPAENETIVIRDLSGTGALAALDSTYAEACVVARCDTNRNTSTGRRIYLRKYYHMGVMPSATTGSLNGSATLPVGTTGPVKTCLETLREVTLSPGSILVTLCAPGGQQVSDSRPVTVLDYLHIRQFRR